MDTSRTTHYSSYPYQRSTQDTVQPPSKEIYQYDAPWLTYALDWCKTPVEQKSFRLAVGSFIEDSNNKVTFFFKKKLFIILLFISSRFIYIKKSCKLSRVQIYLKILRISTKPMISHLLQKLILITLLQKSCGNHER